MREILFRGKCVVSGRWIEGNLLTSLVRPKEAWISESKTFFDGKLCSAGMLEIAPATVGQYTGLTDKNGVKIFEGDILLTTNPNCKIWYVDYKPTAFCANQSNVNYSCILDEFVSGFEAEVIGNIHENPELLSKEDTKC